MSRGMKWTPFYQSQTHTISNDWLVCLDSKGTMRRAKFVDEQFQTLAGEVIPRVSLYANDEAVCKVIDQVEAAFATPTKS